MWKEKIKHDKEKKEKKKKKKTHTKVWGKNGCLIFLLSIRDKCEI